MVHKVKLTSCFCTSGYQNVKFHSLKEGWLIIYHHDYSLNFSFKILVFQKNIPELMKYKCKTFSLNFHNFSLLFVIKYVYKDLCVSAMNAAVLTVTPSDLKACSATQKSYLNFRFTSLGQLKLPWNSLNLSQVAIQKGTLGTREPLWGLLKSLKLLQSSLTVFIQRKKKNQPR